MAGDDLIVNTTWQDLKSKATSKGLSVQFVETSTAYEVFAIDAPIVYQTVIFKGAVPDASFNQVQNDSDKSDFETNYKNLSPVAIESEDTSGRRIVVGSSADGASVSGNPVLIGMSDGSAVRTLRGSNSAPVGTEYAIITRNIPSGTQTVSGTVTANAGTGSFTVAQATASNLNATVVGNVASGSALSGNPVRVAGSDGTNVRNILTNTSGHVIIAGSGTAGSSATGVVTIQGIASGTPVPISGSITATNPSVGTTGNAIPGSSTLIGASDGTNLQALRTSTTTPAGTEQGLITRNIPSGTQAISGTVTANAGTGTFAISAAALPLPTGAATETTLSTRLADSTFTGRINTLGQKTSANSTPVVLASDQSAIAVSGTVTANIGTTNGLALDSTLTGGNARVRITDGTTNVSVKPANTPVTAADPALVVTMSPTPPSDPIVTGAISALNQTVAIATAGKYTIGATITGTWTGTISSEGSCDGGITWFGIRTANKSTNDIVFSYTINDNLEFYSAGGCTHVRLRASAWTSGTANISISATTTATDALLNYSGTNNDTAPPLRHLSFALHDESLVLRLPKVANATPIGTEYAIITRNIPSGTQAVSGTITSNIGTTGGLALDATLTGGTVRTRITDGTNNAALTSTAPAGTEQALVVRNIPSGTQTVQEQKASTATTSNVSASTSSVTLLASNVNRIGATIYNDSNQSLFIKFGTTASSTSFTVKLAPNAYYEVMENYTGRIDGIWTSANGAARITEMT